MKKPFRLEKKKETHICKPRDNEKWVENVADYYTRYEIGERIFLTFADFMDVVESGRWDEFIEGISLPDPHPEIKKGRTTYKLHLNEHGYGILRKTGDSVNVESFGLTPMDRIKAMKRFVELTGHEIKEVS